MKVLPPIHPVIQQALGLAQKLSEARGDPAKVKDLFGGPIPSTLADALGIIYHPPGVPKSVVAVTHPSPAVQEPLMTRYWYLAAMAGKGGMGNPTSEEYRDDALMKKAIKGNLGAFLIDPDKGFSVENIHADRFVSSPFILKGTTGEEKRFTGQSLLRNRGLAKAKADIVDLLRNLGFVVKGDVLEKFPVTPQEYAKNSLMKRAIEGNLDAFLIDQARGLSVENIRTNRFARSFFTFTSATGGKKGFIGESLLRNRGFVKTLADVVSLLRGLGFEVKGNVVEKLSVTQQEYADNSLMRTAIEGNLDAFLIDPAKGLSVENIHADRFLNSTFILTSATGEEKGFTGQSLFRNRGLAKTKADVVNLLRDLGFVVEGDVVERHRITAQEYADNSLMRTAIEGNLGGFLIDPAKGLSVENIHANRFAKSPFAFTSPEGEKGFAGQTLLIYRGLANTKADIVKLLRDFTPVRFVKFES